MAYVSTPFLFPFCIGSDSGTTGDVPFPLPQSEAIIAEWFWRIQGWKVTITPDDPLIGGPENHSYSVSPSNEQELVCLGFGELLNQTQEFEFPLAGLTVNFNFRLFYDEGSGYPAVFDGSNYFTSIFAADQSGVPISEITSLGSTSFKARIDTDVLQADVEFLAESWWAYDPGDGGGPVWNVLTGSQIRDPFSIQSP